MLSLLPGCTVAKPTVTSRLAALSRLYRMKTLCLQSNMSSPGPDNAVISRL